MGVKRGFADSGPAQKYALCMSSLNLHPIVQGGDEESLRLFGQRGTSENRRWVLRKSFRDTLPFGLANWDFRLLWDYFDLEEFGPQLAGYEEAVVPCVPGDAVEDCLWT